MQKVWGDIILNVQFSYKIIYSESNLQRILVMRMRVLSGTRLQEIFVGPFQRELLVLAANLP